MVMCPDSIGSRNTSNTLRSNSGNSSRNNTPCNAIEISPGRGLPPPPTSATPEAVWCGARYGRVFHLDTLKLPSRDCTAALCNASASDICGRMPGEALRQHGFSGTRRPHHQNAMPARCGNLKGALGLRLSLHFAHVRVMRRDALQLADKGIDQFASGKMCRHLQQ